MFVTFPVHKRQRMMIALMQPVEDTVDQDNSVPPQPVAVDEAAEQHMSLGSEVAEDINDHESDAMSDVEA